MKPETEIAYATIILAIWIVITLAAIVVTIPVSVLAVDDNNDNVVIVNQ